MPDYNASPCVGVCDLDPASGFCLGCARTGEEIADWRDGPETLRRAAWEALPERFERLGVAMRRLPWTAEEIGDFVERTLREASGAWMLGVHGASGVFSRDAAEPLELRRGAGTDAETIEALTPRAALRLSPSKKLRAFGFARADAPPRIFLALHRAFLKLPVAATLTALDMDADALRENGRVAPLFDLGLGRQTARFCVRAEAPELAARLAAAEGQPWPRHLSVTGPGLLAASPTRVIETAIGRVEIDTPIAPPGGRRGDGPHTELAPDLLALERDLPAGMELPLGYVAGAVFTPTGA